MGRNTIFREIMMDNFNRDLDLLENLSKKILNHFKNPTILKKKTIIAKKNLYRFETIRHCKIYTNLFNKI